jgi:hypothetical protein
VTVRPPRKHENAKGLSYKARFVVSCFRGFFLFTLCGFASCAPALMRLPQPPGGPLGENELRETLDENSQRCRAHSTMTAEVSVKGSVAGQRLRGRMTLGVERPASVRLEAVAPFGAPIFILVARGDDATLLLPRDARVVEHGRSKDVLDAVTGVPLTSQELVHITMGCVTDVPHVAAREFDDTWRLYGNETGDWYFHRDGRSKTWVLTALVHQPSTGEPGWRVDFSGYLDGSPHVLRLTSLDGGEKHGATFDLQLALSQVESNTRLGANVFSVQIPPGSQPITLNELKHARPGVREN